MEAKANKLAKDKQDLRCSEMQNSLQLTMDSTSLDVVPSCFQMFPGVFPYLSILVGCK